MLERERLIISRLTGNLSGEEQERFQDLMVTDASFKAEYEKYLQVWDASEVVQSSTDKEFDSKLAWDDFEDLKSPVKKKTRIIKPEFIKTFYRVAAVVLLVLSSVLIYNQFNVEGFEAGVVFTNDKQNTVQGLKDGSMVYLSDHSSLEIDKSFNRDDRKMRLDGKAFFVVKPDKDRVFEVVTNHLTATVKGTTFLIRTDDHSASVGVNTGIVEVHVGNQTVLLHAGDQLDFSYNKGGVVSRSKFDSGEVNDLKELVMDYYDTPLKVILDNIKSNLDLEIKAPENLENQRFTVELSGVSNDQIVETIAFITRTTASQDGEIYVLK